MTPTSTRTEYLVQYGRAGYVGRFQCCTQDEVPSRAALVVIRTPRGEEAGTVLCAVREPGSTPSDGDLLRSFTDRDHARQSSSAALEAALVTEAEARVEATALPLTVLDVEVLHDLTTAILHILPYEACNADALVTELEAKFRLTVRLFDVTRTQVTVDPPEPSTSCGKPGCGSEGGGCSSCGTTKGGCSTGSCSKGSVKSAEELTTYFADLRSKMEASGLGRRPLN